MKYVKAENVLPEHLIKEIQQYVKGNYIYIPTGETPRKKWGEKSGTREYIKQRNENIKARHKEGLKISELADEFFLSIYSIKKIVYSKNC